MEYVIKSIKLSSRLVLPQKGNIYGEEKSKSVSSSPNQFLRACPASCPIPPSFSPTFTLSRLILSSHLISSASARLYSTSRADLPIGRRRRLARLRSTLYALVKPADLAIKQARVLNACRVYSIIVSIMPLHLLVKIHNSPPKFPFTPATTLAPLTLMLSNVLFRA